MPGPPIRADQRWRHLSEHIGYDRAREAIMPDDPEHPQPLDYHVPSSAQRRPRTLALILILAAAALLVALGGWFFSVSGPSTPLVRTSGSRILNGVPASPTVGQAPVPGFATSLQDPDD